MPDVFSGDPTPTQPTTASPQPAPLAAEPPPAATTLTPTESHPVGLFTTYCPYPRGVSFAQQEDNETILLFLRRDFVTNVPWIVATLFLLIVPFLIRFIFVTLNFSLFSIPTGVLVPLISFYYIIVVGYAFANLVSWFYNIGLVTTKRGVDIDFYDLSTVNVATAALPDIIDVEYTQAGFFQSFFDYGDVRLRIEASGEVFVFEKVPRPSEVSGIVSRLIGGRG
jgi:hypothetical protein